MEKLSNFKSFVKKNPGLIKHVKSNDMTWQKFYEIYDLYGEEDNAWGDYLTRSNVAGTVATVAAATGVAGIGDLFGWMKNLDMEALQGGISNIQRVVGLLQDFTVKDEAVVPKDEYKPRPLYKHFED